MLDIIVLLLTLVMTYCFSMWLVYAYMAFRARHRMSDNARREIADFTFRVGLCGVVAAGLLGIIISMGSSDVFRP